MSEDIFGNGRVVLHAGDCLDVLDQLDESSIDSCVTDPPYHLTSIVKRFGGEGAAPAQFGKDGVYARAAAGFMGKKWDGGDVAFRPETWAKVLRVLKPGGHLLAFGGTRTFARMSVAIEDAGFEIRDTIMWLYGTGFPKSHDVSKGIDKAAGHWRGRAGGVISENGSMSAPNYERTDKGEPILPEASQWEGWGTALKPAVEPIVLARKPLSEPTVAANVLKWGTGAINVGACRVGTEQGSPFGRPSFADDYRLHKRSNDWEPSGPGRWPANVIHDGSDEVVGAFPDVGKSTGGRCSDNNVFGNFKGQERDFTPGNPGYGDSGSAARFFYSAKADTDDRLGSKHPTVKPVDLMQYLVRLVTPPNGVVLDPFAGTGTTGEAAWREGMRAVLIEAELEYQADIKRRMALILAGPDERARETIKASKRVESPDMLPLFQFKEAAE